MSMLDKSRPLEPAIPEHLRVPRTRPAVLPEGFVPVTRSFSARFQPGVKTLPMVFYGVQYRTRSRRSALALLAHDAGFAAASGPAHWDRAEYVDELGYVNTVSVGYWDSRAAYDAWHGGLPTDWWHEGAALDGDLGYFRECFTPGIEDTETTFSHPQPPEGYSVIAAGMSGEVLEHGYWGASRDRIPRGQTEAMAGAGQPRAEVGAGTTLGRRIAVEPHENLCLLRSGQDWCEAGEAERRAYRERVEPMLRRGMAQLRDAGGPLGCHFNRFMTVLSDAGPVDKTYSMSAWQSLDDTERWARAAEHLAIFGAGVSHYNTFGDDAKLRLYHEMSVIRARDQAFEYFNCHPRTGMLNPIFGQGATP